MGGRSSVVCHAAIHTQCLETCTQCWVRGWQRGKGVRATTCSTPLKRRVGANGLPLLLQVWRANDMGGWDEEQALHGHKDWVRDAAWAPNLGMPLSTIASAGQDGQVG